MTTTAVRPRRRAASATELDRRIAELARRDRPLAARLLKELIRVPRDLTRRSLEDGGDPRCGLSNHEGPRLELLWRRLLEFKAVRRPSDVRFDEFGNLVWTVQDGRDGIPPEDKRVILLDGHADTVEALPHEWSARLGPGLDAYEGLTDPARVDRGALLDAAGHVPPEAEWPNVVFGRGAADQLAGLVCQVMATRILLELEREGALRGVIVRSYATVAEEDNDGGAALFLKEHLWPGAPAQLLPDLVVLTEATGHARDGALGIYRGQRGRMQIEVRVTGRSCHGSMPGEGLNPLEHGAAILDEAARRQAAGEGVLDHPVLGRGSRTASWARLETPSDCAVPECFVFRFDRRLTLGEEPERALADLEALEAVARARRDGLRVEIGIPRYHALTWCGWTADNPQVYPGWLTPEDHPAVRAALRAYRGVVTPHVAEGQGEQGGLRREPRVGTWIFSTDGVGYPVRLDDDRIEVPDRKGWVASAVARHPAMIGIGPGHEQNAHRIGENVDLREVVHAAALLARLPSAFVEEAGV